LCLSSKESGFGYEEMLRMPAHILISLWTAKRNLAEEQNKAEQKAYDKQTAEQSGMMKNMNPASMMSSAKSMMPSGMPSTGSFSIPSIKR
jgi:hypothetical protein